MAIVKARTRFISDIASVVEVTASGITNITLPTFWTEAKIAIVGGGGGGSTGNIAGTWGSSGLPGEMKTIELPYARYKALGATAMRVSVGTGGAAGTQGVAGTTTSLDLFVSGAWSAYAIAAGGRGGYAPNGNWSGNVHTTPNATGFNNANMAVVGFAGAPSPLTLGLKGTTATSYYYINSASSIGAQCIPQGHMQNRGQGGSDGNFNTSSNLQGAAPVAGSSGYAQVHFFQSYAG